MIRIACPDCKATYTAEARDAGKKAACQVCGRRLQVPALPSTPPPNPAWVGASAGRPPQRRRPSAGVLAAMALGLVALLGGAGALIALAVPRLKQVNAPVAERPALAEDPPAVSGSIDEPVRGTLEPAGPNPDPLSAEQLYPRLVRCSVLVADLDDGMGSGFVIHKDRRLVVTNYHVVGRASKVAVVFPLYEGAGELVTDARRYESRIREIAVRGEVIARDSARDLALIRAERVPGRANALPLARRPAATGSVVYSVGGSGANDNLLWRFTKGNVRGRVQRAQWVESGRIDCVILETDAPVNRGDSGGAVINDRGELVAVVSHMSTVERQVSGNIDVEEVRAFVARHLPR